MESFNDNLTLRRIGLPPRSDEPIIKSNQSQRPKQTNQRDLNHQYAAFQWRFTDYVVINKHGTTRVCYQFALRRAVDYFNSTHFLSNLLII